MNKKYKIVYCICSFIGVPDQFSCYFDANRTSKLLSCNHDINFILLIRICYLLVCFCVLWVICLDGWLLMLYISHMLVLFLSYCFSLYTIQCFLYLPSLSLSLCLSLSFLFFCISALLLFLLLSKSYLLQVQVKRTSYFFVFFFFLSV